MALSPSLLNWGVILQSALITINLVPLDRARARGSGKHTLEVGRRRVGEKKCFKDAIFAKIRTTGSLAIGVGLPRLLHRQTRGADTTQTHQVWWQTDAWLPR